MIEQLNKWAAAIISCSVPHVPVVRLGRWCVSSTTKCSLDVYFCQTVVICCEFQCCRDLLWQFCVMEFHCSRCLFFRHTLLLKKAYQHKGKTCEIAKPFSVSEHVQCVVLYLQLASELVVSSNAVEWLVSLYLLFFCVLLFRFISLYLLSVSHRRFIFSRVTLFFFCR